MSHSRQPNTEPSQGGALRLSAPSLALFGTVCLVAAALELAALAAYSREGISLAGFLALHALLVAALAGYGWAARRRGGDLRLSALLVLCVAFAGPAGALGALLSAALLFIYQKNATPFDEWYESLFPEKEDRFAEEVHRRIRQTRDQINAGRVPTPFVDVLEFGTIPQKQTVVAMVAKHFRPAFAPTLHMALNDEANAIRVQAATAMARLEEQFSEKAQSLSKRLKKRPDDAEALLEAARHCDDYAYCGILDATREVENRADAMRYYRRYLEKVPSDGQARLAVGRLLVRAGRCQEASDWFRQCAREGFASPQFRIWHLECLYSLGRWEEIRRIVSREKNLADLPRLPPRLRQALALWAA